jgi:hypothetical protein
MIRNFVTALAAAGIVAGGITAGAAGVNALASSAPAVQQQSTVTSVAWLPGTRTCSVHYDQYGRRYYICR